MAKEVQAPAAPEVIRGGMTMTMATAEEGGQGDNPWGVETSQSCAASRFEDSRQVRDQRKRWSQNLPNGPGGGEAPTGPGGG